MSLHPNSSIKKLYLNFIFFLVFFHHPTSQFDDTPPSNPLKQKYENKREIIKTRDNPTIQ
jgi:hypothetical protein